MTPARKNRENSAGSPVRNKPESLSGIVKIGAVVLVLSLGLWGCARKPAARTGSSDNKVLESKVQKLEQELRTANQARDKAKKDLTAVETESARLQQEAAEKAALVQEKSNLLEKIKAAQADRDELHKTLVARTAERDDLRNLIGQRSQERDAMIIRVERMRKGLQQILTQDDNPNGVPGAPDANPTTPGVTPATPTATPTAGPSLGNQG